MSDNGEVEVEAISGYQVLPKEVVEEMAANVGQARAVAAAE